MNLNSEMTCYIELANGQVFIQFRPVLGLKCWLKNPTVGFARLQANICIHYGILAQAE